MICDELKEKKRSNLKLIIPFGTLFIYIIYQEITSIHSILVTFRKDQAALIIGKYKLMFLLEGVEVIKLII